METCCGNQYDCLGKNKHQLVFYDTIIHFNLSREGQTENNLKRQIILQDRFLLRQMTYFQRRPKIPLKRKDNSSQMNNNTHERIFCHQSYSFSNLLLNQKKNIPKDSFRILTEFFFTIPKNCSWEMCPKQKFTST